MDEQRFHFSKISRHVVQDYNVIENESFKVFKCEKQP